MYPTSMSQNRLIFENINLWLCQYAIGFMFQQKEYKFDLHAIHMTCTSWEWPPLLTWILDSIDDVHLEEWLSISLNIWLCDPRCSWNILEHHITILGCPSKKTHVVKYWLEGCKCAKDWGWVLELNWSTITKLSKYHH